MREKEQEMTGAIGVAAVSHADMISYTDVQQRIVCIRDTSVIIDANAAALYGVETKHVNQAMRNNRDKFPADYVFELTSGEVEDLRSKILTAKLSLKSRVAPKAFTEKGLYMLATILKSKRATAATFAIIETFAKVRGLKRELVELHRGGDKRKQADKTRHFGETHKERFILDDISGLADSLMALYKQSYDILLPVVDDMCWRKENVTQDELDHCFDSVSEIACTDFGKKLFDRLCVAFKSKYPESVNFYIKDYEKLYGDCEEDDNVNVSKDKRRKCRSRSVNVKKGGLK